MTWRSMSCEDSYHVGMPWHWGYKHDIGGHPGLTHHNSESGLAGKPCLLVNSKLLDHMSKLLDHMVATFR